MKKRDSCGIAPSSNKKDLHVKACLHHDVEAAVPSGFEKVKLRGFFPEFCFSEMDTSCEFLGKTLALPLIIAPMTGGGSLSEKINMRLAKVAETLGLGMCLGSQKLMLDNLYSPDSYLLRGVAPTIPLLANIGLVHVKRGKDYLLKAVESVDADALLLYVNPLQEVLQEGGEKDFCGILERLEEIMIDFPYPIILKEVGSGIPENLMKWAATKTAIRGIDVAGLGGTNWIRIEGLMADSDYELYEGLGTETATAIMTARKYVSDDRYLIASGGIRSGIDMAKALALGANIVAIGLPFLRWAVQSQGKIINGVDNLKKQLQVAMWYTGSKNIGELQGKFIGAV